MQVTNNHLKTLIGQASNFIFNNTPLPEDLAFVFVEELKVSNLILPIKFHDDAFKFPNVLGDNESLLIPLFTDNDEFSKKFSDEYEPFPNDLAFYVNLINDLDFDGIIINSESDEFFVDKVLLNQISTVIRDNTGKYDALKLREIGESVTNEPLLEMIRNGEFDDNIVEALGQSILLNVISTDESDDDGIICRNDVYDFRFTTVRQAMSEYGALFTSIDEIKKSSYDQDNYYFQITNLYEVFKFVLMNDLDGVVINPGFDKCYIERHVLIRIYEDERLENPDLANSIDYAFKI